MTDSWRSVAALACGACVLLHSAPATAQDPPVTEARSGSPLSPGVSIMPEAWFVLVDGDIEWGSIHERITLMDDGSIVVEQTSRSLIELLGAPQEIRGRSRVVVDASLAPVELESEVTQASGTVRIEARRNGDAIEVTTRSGDETQTRTVPLEDGRPFVADALLPAWLARLPVDVASAEVTVLDSASGSVGPVRAERLPSTDGRTTWRLDPGAVPGEGVLHLDADGRLVELLQRFPPVRLVRRDAAPDALVHRRLPDRELLVFPVNRSLPPGRRIERIDVELSWRDIDPATLDLEDARQALRTIESRDGATRAVVSLGVAPTPLPDVELPVQDETLAPFLATTDFLQPEDEAIVRTAREIVGETRSARAAAEAICRWVAASVQNVMIAETLTGPDVLRKRIGKCTEFTTLYGSLARAAGIPTRVALGQRLFPGADRMYWGGHMWNEVWIGAWIPVDASTGEFGGSPALLKLVDSDTVAGTQEVRWRLTESLAVSVVEVAEAPAGPDAQAVEDGERDGTWTSARHRIRARLPGDGWTFERVGDGPVLVLRLRPPPELDRGDEAMLHLTVFDLPAGAPPRAVVHARLAGHRAALPELDVLLDEEAVVSGAPGHRLQFRGKPTDAPPLVVTELLWSRAGTGVLVNVISSEPLHESWLPYLEAVAASVDHLEG